MANAAEILKLCRLCLVKDQVTIPIFDGQGDVKQIFLKITACLPIKVSRKDCLPKSICNACLLKLEVLYEFWNTTANSEKTLITWLNEAGVDTTNCNAIENNQIIPEEIILKEEAIDVADRDHAVDDISSDAKNYASDQQAPVTYNTPSFEFQNDILNAQGKKESPSKKSNNESSAKRKRAPSTRRRTPTAKAIKYEEETEEESAGEDFAAKVEDDSDYVADNDTSIMGFDQDESIDEPPPTSSASDQPGPSGVQKATGEPPSINDYFVHIVSTFNGKRPILFKKTKSTKTKRRPSRNSKRHAKRDEYEDDGIDDETDDASADERDEPRLSTNHCEVRKFACPHCNGNGNNEMAMGETELRKHIKQQHPTQRRKYPKLIKQYRNCYVCNRQIKTFKKLKEHLQLHNKTYNCEECYATFKKLINYVAHLRTHNTETTVYACIYCDYKNESLKEITAHLKQHEKKPIYKCLTCKEGFNISSWYEEHKNFHNGSSPYACEYCDKRFPLSRLLNLHKLSMHRNEYLKGLAIYECTVCKKRYQRKSSLRVHMNRHTGNVSICEICGKQLSSREKLKLHIRIHTGYKPFKCRFCAKSFTKKPILVEHERVHTGEKPYKCSYCEKSFSQRSSLVIHERSHTGERPFSCHICFKSFVARALLNVHMKSCKGLYVYNS